MVKDAFWTFFGFTFICFCSCTNRTFGVKLDEETSPKYIIVYLTPSPSPNSSETDVLWLETLSPAEKIAIILAITILLVIILTGICYNGRAFCKRSSRQKHHRRSQDSTTTQVSSEMERAHQERAAAVMNEAPSNRQGNGHQGNPQIVIYNMPNIGSSSSDYHHHRSRSEQPRNASRDLLKVPRYSELSPPPIGTPLNYDAENLSHSAPNLCSKSPLPLYDMTAGLNISRSAQCLVPSPGCAPLYPTAPPGDGTVFFN